MLYVTLPDQEDAQQLRIYYIKPGIANRGGRRRLAGGHGCGPGSGAGAAAELQPDAGDDGSLPAGADHALPSVAQAAAAAAGGAPSRLAVAQAAVLAPLPTRSQTPALAAGRVLAQPTTTAAGWPALAGVAAALAERQLHPYQASSAEVVIITAGLLGLARPGRGNAGNSIGDGRDGSETSNSDLGDIRQRSTGRQWPAWWSWLPFSSCGLCSAR